MTAADMQGRVAFVTGGSYGIGRATACRFAEAGASVAIVDIDDERGAETCAMVADLGGEARYLHADVADREQVDAAVAATVNAFGRLDFAHNNAGAIGAWHKTAHYPLEQWEFMLRNNLTSVLLCMQAELEIMLPQGAGAIVNTASETVFKGNAGDVGYTVSKHGVHGLTTVAALEYAQRGIRVNAVAPGTVMTGIVERGLAAAPELVSSFERTMPVGRFGRPEEIAEAVVWLCSDAASLVNGHVLVADGGWRVT